MTVWLMHIYTLFCKTTQLNFATVESHPQGIGGNPGLKVY